MVDSIAGHGPLGSPKAIRGPPMLPGLVARAPKAESLVDASGRFRVLEVRGSARERGYQYGAQTRGAIARELALYFGWFGRYTRYKRTELLRLAAKYWPYVREYSPDAAEELEGLAEGAGKARDELLALQLYGDLQYRADVVGELPGCTAFGVGGAATADGQTHVGVNNDETVDPWWEGGTLLIHSVPDRGPSVLYYTYPGILGQNGMNDRGLALVTNAIMSGQFRLGVPSTILSHVILQRRNLGEAIAAYARAKRSESANYLLSDESELYDLEGTPFAFEAFYSDHRLVHANHFLSTRLDIPRDYLREHGQTIVRYNRMQRLLAQEHGRLDLRRLRAVLADHVNLPRAICRHVDPEEPAREQSRTLDSMIFVPAKREAWIAHGNPCEASFHKYAL